MHAAETSFVENAYGAVWWQHLQDGADAFPPRLTGRNQHEKVIAWSNTTSSKRQIQHKTIYTLYNKTAPPIENIFQDGLYLQISTDSL